MISRILKSISIYNKAFLFCFIFGISFFAKAQEFEGPGFNEDPSVQQYQEWSRGVWSILNDSKRRAIHLCQSARDERDFQDCSDELLRGLSKSLERLPSWTVGPLAADAIARGPSFARTIRNFGKSDELNSNLEMTLSYFLFQYYDHIEYIYKNLDQPFYDPRSRRESQGFPSENPLFQIEIARSAKNQLNMVLDNLTERSYRGPHRNYIVSLGSDRVFLATLELAARYAERDLQSYFRRNLYSDEIERLHILSESLRGYLRNSPPERRPLPSEIMVSQSYAEAKSIANSLSDRCKGNNPQRPDPSQVSPKPTQTETIWGSRFTLYDGDLKSLEILTDTQPRGYPVKAVGAYVKLEAIRHSARVQVHINGELMGDLTLPAVDPNVYINLRGSQPTRSIEFRHISGGRVEVSQVDIVYESPKTNRRDH